MKDVMKDKKCNHFHGWQRNKNAMKGEKGQVSAIITLFFSPYPSVPHQTKFWHCRPPTVPTPHFLSIISLVLHRVSADSSLSVPFSLDGPHGELLKTKVLWHIRAAIAMKNLAFWHFFHHIWLIFIKKDWCINAKRYVSLLSYLTLIKIYSGNVTNKVAVSRLLNYIS